MKIALIGYGKMGKSIETIALERGHTIVARVNSTSPIDKTDLSEAEVAIEFSRPELAIDHMRFCFLKNLPVVVGTTAWNTFETNVFSEVKEKNAALLYSSNFSVGVNIFFEINKRLAELMEGHSDYHASLEEIHHLQKIDAPSGTAITLANGLMENNDDYVSWVHAENKTPHTTDGQLSVTSYRKPDVPGTHVIRYVSDVDTIEISHVAHNRKGFALGAVIAAEFLHGKTGVYTMSDVLKLK
jgi:4-hydroxy-tetrahydrodipicolinate reductase